MGDEWAVMARVGAHVNAILTTRVSERSHGKRVMEGKGMCKLQGGVIVKGMLSGLTGNPNHPTHLEPSLRQAACASTW